MELLQSAIKKLSEDSVNKNPITDNEGKHIPENNDDPENMSMMTESSNIPGKPTAVIRDKHGLMISWDVHLCNLQIIQFFEINWKKSEEKQWSGRQCTKDNSANITVPITELEPNTTYQFKVRWITKEGAQGPFSEISDDITIKTSQKPGKPKEVMSNDTNLLLSWDISSDDLQFVDFFEIQWKKTEEKRWSGRRNTNDNSPSIKLPITDFEQNTVYQFKVRWITQDGAESQFSDISDDIIIKMSQKPGKPKGVISNVTDLLLSWDVLSSDLQTVEVFEIQWKKAEEKRWSGRRNTNDNSPSIKLPITDLEKNTVYQFKVRWITQEGVESQFSDISDDIIIKMSQKPGKPKGVISNDTDLLLSWDVSSTDLQLVDVFEIQWKKAEEKRWSGRRNTNDNSPSIKLSITDFENNTTYQFKVRWILQNGVESQFSDVSDDIVIEILQKPGKPKEVASNDNDLFLNWHVPEAHLQSVKCFEIQWRKIKDKRWEGWKTTNDNSTSIKILKSNFERDVAYQFKVRWTTINGVESPFSDISDDIIIKMPQKPGKPKVVSVNDKDISISWDVPLSNLRAVEIFEIQWKTNEDTTWSGRKCTADNSTSIKIPITDLAQNVAYQFTVRWITKEDVESPLSDISDDVIITRSPQQPGKILCSKTTATSACLYWERPKGPDTVSDYEVKYRSCTDVQWLTANTKQPLLDLKDLKSSNDYVFKVRAIFSDGNDGPFSEVSDKITTQESLATRLKKDAKKLSSVNPQIYKIPLIFSEETTNKTTMTRKGRFGQRDQLLPTKTIMVVGATGAGKSTLIDGMINYIVDAAWEDDFRFTLIDLTEDEKVNAGKQTTSQTNWITCYEVNYQHGGRLNYNLNIIDTPGFGDTRGIDQDKRIVDQIREFFMAPGDQGIDSIDAVCFVTQAPLARLTPTQKYIFDSILSVFGKDVKDNIFVLITFADGKEPPVLAALKEANVPFQRSFNFNNSALFACSNASEPFPQLFWKLGISSFDKFFDDLLKVQQRSLRLTSEVLELRKQIENTIERLQPQIQDGLHKLNTMKAENEILEKHKRDIEDNRNFHYVTEEIHQRKVDTKPGQYVTNCFVCNSTCHPQCSYADDNDKAKCCAMGKNGNCTICQGKCHWSKHRNNNFYYETYKEKVEGTYENLRMKYESAVSGEQKQASTIQKIKSAFKTLGRSVMSMMKIVRDSVNKLEQGALKPNPLNEVNYVKLLIDSEKREAKAGWENRVKLLEEFKMKAELVQKIPNKSTEWTDEEVENFFNSV